MLQFVTSIVDVEMLQFSFLKHIYSCTGRALPYIMILAVITLSQSQKSVCLFLFRGTYDHPCVKQAKGGL